MKKVRSLAAFLAVVLLVTAVPFNAEAASNFSMRRRVVSMLGIVTGEDTNEYTTRGQFARMLVNASPYKESTSQTSSTAVFADVPASHQYASYIKVATQNGWMNTYLGGLFKPDELITLQEAIRGVLALLGYTDEDFLGDQNGGRWRKYVALDLGDEIGKEANEVLTWTDSINLFYNTLCADTRNGQEYATTLGYAITSDGEVNAMDLLDNSLKGPKLLKRGQRIEDAVPFDVSQATFYLNGSYASLESVKQARDDGFIVVYYNTAAKTVWCYASDDIGGSSDNSKVAIYGEITGIFYNSTNLYPSSVQLDYYDDVTFTLGNTDVQFAFSIYGQFKVGDKVVLICDRTSSGNGDYSYNYTVTDYVEY